MTVCQTWCLCQAVTEVCVANSHNGLCDGTASSSNVCAGMSMLPTCLLQHTDSLGLLGTQAPVMTAHGVDIPFLSTLVGM